MLSFTELRTKNVARCEQVFHPLHDWSLNDWLTGVAGEVGEAANIIKKIRRGDFDLDCHADLVDPKALTGTIRDVLGDEIADIAIYTDLLAARAGVDLERVIIGKFNYVSRKRKSTIFLGKASIT